MRPDQFQQLRMDRAPDGRAHRTLRRRAARQRIEHVEPRHIFHRDFHFEFEALRRAGVDYVTGR